MAKESMKAREVKREKCVAKYADKRAALKAAGDFVGLQKLPKNIYMYIYIGLNVHLCINTVVIHLVY